MLQVCISGINDHSLAPKPFPHQVGGHCRLLKSKGRVMKPLIEREYQFYERACFEFPQILPFTAHYYGCVSLHSGENNSSETSEGNSEYIILQDLTYRYRRPCIMDIKMGTRQKGIICSTTTSSTLGIRICGMKVYRPGVGYESRDRFFGRGLTASTMEAAVRNFLFDGKGLRYDVIPLLAHKLRALIDILEEKVEEVYEEGGDEEINNRPFPFRLYSSSLLIVYEGDVGGSSVGKSKNGGDISDELYDHSKSFSRSHQYPRPRSSGKLEARGTGGPLVEVKMIDFAHAISKGDEEGIEEDGYLFGLRNLLSLVTRISSTGDSTEDFWQLPMPEAHQIDTAA